jgi:putative redox protein
MTINLQLQNQAFHLEAVNETGNRLQIDASPTIGGENLGFRPMQLLLAALGGCSTIDILNILRKQRQLVSDIQISVEGERETGVEPSLWQKIHVHYTLTGNPEPEKVRKAIDLSMQKLCSVAKTLEKTATITYSFEVKTI